MHLAVSRKSSPWIAFLLCVCAAEAGIPEAAAPREIRVKETPGGPQIHVDGKAVPPRMVYVRDQPLQCPLRPWWTEYRFSFVPKEDADIATLRMRFHMRAGSRALLRNFKMAEDGSPFAPWLAGAFEEESAFSASWRVEPEDRTYRRFVSGGVCEVAFHPTRQAPVPDYRFRSRPMRLRKGVEYAVSFEALGESSWFVIPQVVRENGDGTETAFQVTLGEEAGNALLPTIRKAHAAGVDFVSYLGYEPPWREDGDDWSSLDALTEAIVGENPGALLVPRVYVDAPKWWLERNPEHRMQFAAEHADAPGEQNRLGHCIRPDMASVSSRDYRAAASAYLRRFCRHMIEKYPRNFAGIHPAAQNSHEFFYFDSWNRMSGYDPQTLAAWRKWTGDATAVVPSASERLALVGQAPILDAASQMQCIEFNRFLQAEMADFAAEMAHACREATLGRSLVLLFYGYSWEFSPHQLGPANSGHYGLERLLKEAAGDIDILCAPISYWDRGRLGSSPRMAAAETVMRSGVLWLNEDDSRTYRDVRVAEYVHEGSKVSLPQSRMVLLRNTAQEVLCGYGSWWMDLSGLGWYDSEELWSIQRALMPLEKALLARSRRFEPEFALVVDEESMIQLSGGTTALCAPLVKGARAEAARCGAPYGQYLLADVCRNPPKAKLQVFQSCWSLSNEKLESLVLQREAIPAVRVWCWAPGWRDGDGRPDTDRMTRLTGFQFQTLASPIEGAVFTVNEESADEVLDRFPDGSPSLAIRRRGDGADVFVAKPGDLNASLLHRLAELAGVHLFLQGGEVGKATLCFAEIDEGEYVLEIQALEATTLHLRFPGGGQIVDALDGRILGTGPDIAVDFCEGEVRVLKSARKESQRDDSSSRP